MSESTLYLTGFEPFLKIRQNPTEAIARELDGAVIGGLVVRSRVLPVTWEEAPRILTEDIARLEPALCLQLGVSGQAKTIRLEGSAHNAMASTFADNAGVEMEDQPIDLERGLEHRLQTPVDRSPMISRLDAAGLPSELCEDPGRYICNRAYYEVLALGAPPALFMHVPHTDNRDPSGEPWTLPRLVQGTRIVLQALTETARVGG
jgi:pyroglutamyl-peptidase